MAGSFRTQRISPFSHTPTQQYDFFDDLFVPFSNLSIQIIYTLLYLSN